MGKSLKILREEFSLIFPLFNEDNRVNLSVNQRQPVFKLMRKFL
jgi:hypothetical protein